jgi:hypothetical protein
MLGILLENDTRLYHRIKLYQGAFYDKYTLSPYQNFKIIL